MPEQSTPWEIAAEVLYQNKRRIFAIRTFTDRRSVWTVALWSVHPTADAAANAFVRSPLARDCTWLAPEIAERQAALMALPRG